MTDPDGVHTERELMAHAVERGIAPPGPLTARHLSGGVSSIVVAVEGPTEGLVLKRALPRLRVPDEWIAPTTRTATEARAVTLFSSITPTRVSRLIDFDQKTNTLAIERAPVDGSSLRDVLLTTTMDPWLGEALATTLASWHAATWKNDTASTFDDPGAFDALRVRPYHRTVIARFPELTGRILECVDELQTGRWCVVHGDYSPKNVLIGPSCLWVVDHEVAHFGDPVFDVAFFVAHLVLSAVLDPSRAGSLERIAEAFVQTYLNRAPPANLLTRLDDHVAAILLARTDGLSRELALKSGQADKVRDIGSRILSRRRPSAPRVWDDVREVMAWIS